MGDSFTGIGEREREFKEEMKIYYKKRCIDPELGGWGRLEKYTDELSSSWENRFTGKQIQKMEIEKSGCLTFFSKKESMGERLIN